MSEYKLKDREYQLICTSPREKKIITDLRLVFNIEKYGDSTPNKAELEITNLSLEFRDFFKQAQDREEDISIVLNAGYKNNSGLLFKGTITRQNSSQGRTYHARRRMEIHKKGDVDWVTTLVCRDGIKHLAPDMYITISLESPDLTERQVLNKVIDKLNDKVKLEKGTIKFLKETKINNGISFSSPFKVIMDYICLKNNLQWYITDEIIYVLPIKTAINDSVIVLDETSGMIGSPETTDTGYKVVSLSRHEFAIGKLVKINSQLVKGIFLIANLTHTGDTSSTNWYTELELIPRG